MPAGQRAALGQRRPLRVRGPFRVDLEDRAAILGRAFAQRLPEGRPLLEVAVEDGSPRRIVQCQTAGKPPSKHGGGPDRPTSLDPEIPLDSPAVARLEAAPRPGLQQGGVARLRNERVPGGRILAGGQFGHAFTAYPAISPTAPNTASLTVRLSYLACASIGGKSRGGGRLLVSSIEQAPRLVDYKGSLDSTPLLSLLQSMQAQRATGTLQVRNGGEAFSLFFLFGHLFHAFGNGSQGEEAVFEPLAWRQGDYTFDPKSKLPTEETITAPTADILAEAKRRGVPGADNGPVAAIRSPAPQATSPAAAAPVASHVSERA